MQRKKEWLKRKLGKKGNVTDIITVLVVLFVFMSVVLVAFTIQRNFNTQIQTLDVSQNAKDVSQKFEDRYVNWDDNWVPILYIGLMIFSVAAAKFIRTDSIFYSFLPFLLIFIFLFSLIIPEMWAGYKENATLATNIAEWPKTDFMFSYPIPFVGLYVIIVGVVLYYRRNEGS